MSIERILAERKTQKSAPRYATGKRFPAFYTLLSLLICKLSVLLPVCVRVLLTQLPLHLCQFVLQLLRFLFVPGSCLELLFQLFLLLLQFPDFPLHLIRIRNVFLPAIVRGIRIYFGGFSVSVLFGTLLLRVVKINFFVTVLVLPYIVQAVWLLPRRFAADILVIRRAVLV